MMRGAAEPNPWAQSADWHLRTNIAPHFRTTPDKITQLLDGYYRSFWGDRPAPPWPVVYRAIGVLPTLESLSADGFTADLRADIILRDHDGKPANSCRMYNYSTIEEPSTDFVHRFHTPHYLSDVQRHVSPLDIEPPDFYGPDAAARGWRMPDDGAKIALFFTEYQTDNKQPALLVIDLIGASAATNTVELGEEARS